MDFRWKKTGGGGEGKGGKPIFQKKYKNYFLQSLVFPLIAGGGEGRGEGQIRYTFTRNIYKQVT